MKVNDKVETVNTGKKLRIIGYQWEGSHKKWQTISDDEGYVGWYYTDQIQKR